MSEELNDLGCGIRKILGSAVISTNSYKNIVFYLVQHDKYTSELESIKAFAKLHSCDLDIGSLGCVITGGLKKYIVGCNRSLSELAKFYQALIRAQESRFSVGNNEIAKWYLSLYNALAETLR